MSTEPKLIADHPTLGKVALVAAVRKDRHLPHVQVVLLGGSSG